MDKNTATKSLSANKTTETDISENHPYSDWIKVHRVCQWIVSMLNTDAFLIPVAK